MNIPIILQLETAFSQLESRLESIISEYQKNDEFIIIPNFLPETVIEIMKKEAFNLNANIHRSFIPKHKKGGSVSRNTIYDKTDIFKQLYESENFREILGKITNEKLKICPKMINTVALYTITMRKEILLVIILIHPTILAIDILYLSV